MLPTETFVLPAALAAPAGLVADVTSWKRISDPAEDLVSSVFLNQGITLALEGESVARLWTGISFTPNGTLAPLAGGPPPKGLLVIATGVRRAPGAYAPGESPIQLSNPEAVRGLVISAYGVPALLNERSAF